MGNLRGGEFELHPRFHVTSLAWRATRGDAVLEDFRGKDCAFVANWLRGKGLNKLCAVFDQDCAFVANWLRGKSLNKLCAVFDQDCAFVANWLRGKSLNKLCAVFEVFKF